MGEPSALLWAFKTRTQAGGEAEAEMLNRHSMVEGHGAL